MAGKKDKNASKRMKYMWELIDDAEKHGKTLSKSTALDIAYEKYPVVKTAAKKSKKSPSKNMRT